MKKHYLHNFNVSFWLSNTQQNGIELENPDQSDKNIGAKKLLDALESRVNYFRSHLNEFVNLCQKSIKTTEIENYWELSKQGKKISLSNYEQTVTFNSVLAILVYAKSNPEIPDLIINELIAREGGWTALNDKEYAIERNNFLKGNYSGALITLVNHEHEHFGSIQCKMNLAWREAAGKSIDSLVEITKESI